MKSFKRFLIPFLIGVFTTAAHADVCQPARSFINGIYEFQLCDVPDLDQIRAIVPPFFPGLPGDGDTYCVPTSTMNWFVFLANRLPALNIAPGPGYYGLEQCGQFGPCPQYEKITNALLKLGNYMGTSVQGGTDGNGFLKGAQQWLADNELAGLITASDYLNDGGADDPVTLRMARSAVLGNFVMPGIGWYTTFENLTPLQQLQILQSLNFHTLKGWWRDGGHALTLTHAEITAKGEFPKIGVSDPANGGTTTSQSPFQEDEDYPGHVDDFINGFYQHMEFSGLYNKSGVFYDGYGALRPVFLISVEGPKVHIYNPLDPLGGRGPVMANFSSANGGKVIEVAAHPETDRHAYLAEGSNAIYQLDPLTGMSSRFAEVPGAKKLAFGDADETLFVLTHGELFAISRTGMVMHREPLRGEINAIDYDFEQRRLVGISLAERKLVAFDSRLQRIAEVPIMRQRMCTTNYHLKFNPADHSLLGYCDGDMSLMQFMWMRGSLHESEFMLAGLRSAMGFTVSDIGHVFLTDGGKVKEFDASFRPVMNSVWGQVPGMGALDILRGYYKYNPQWVNTFMYFNRLPPGTTIMPGGR